MTTTSSSTSALAINGLASGLDTAGIISKLMSVESLPQTALKTELSGVTSYRSALQSLNSQLASLATAATAAAKPGALTAFTATSDSSAVSAKASSSASAGSISFTVGRLAQAQVSVTDPVTAWPDASGTPSITIQSGSGSSATTRTVTAASNSLDDVVAAINAGGTGVTATKVAAGQDPSTGAPQYRLQLRSSSTGSAAAFSVYAGADSTAPTLSKTDVSTAQDASITLWPSTAVAQEVTSSSNTFSNLLTGVDVAVSATTTSPATLTVATDPSTAAAKAASLTSSLMSVFSSIAAQSKITTKAGATGSATSTTGGVFTGDLAVRQANSALLSAATDPINGVSPSSIGITLTRDGGIAFDQSVFTAAMAKDPAGTTSFLQTVAGRVAGVATAQSDPYSGALTQKVTSERSQESRLNKQISDWDARLAVIQSTYQRQYNALEKALSSLNSQAAYMTSQLSSLTTSTK